MRLYRMRNRVLYYTWLDVCGRLEEEFGLAVHADVKAYFETPVCTHVFHVSRNFASVQLCMASEVVVLGSGDGALVRFYGYTGENQVRFAPFFTCACAELRLRMRRCRICCM